MTAKPVKILTRQGTNIERSHYIGWQSAY